MILKLDRARGRGVVRSHSGKEIPFEFPFVAVAGARIGGTMPGIDLIREGDIVGFDVGWTSKGLRVTTIHPRTADEEPNPNPFHSGKGTGLWEASSLALVHPPRLDA